LRASVKSNHDAAHSILPLAVLEAMRNLDSPSDEEVAEYVDELLRKRLGISRTVTAQIGRYEQVARQDGGVSRAELEQILRLAGRRTDAALVFAEGGRRAARRALGRLPRLTLWSARSLPRPVRRAVGMAAARRSAADVFDAAMQRVQGGVVARLLHGVSVAATPDGAACTFYASAFAELLRQLVEFEGSVNHVRCRARGDERCEWRTAGAGERKWASTRSRPTSWA
jgi:bacteriochlorophyll 4-vinyl reductase